MANTNFYGWQQEEGPLSSNLETCRVNFTRGRLLVSYDPPHTAQVSILDSEREGIAENVPNQIAQSFLLRVQNLLVKHCPRGTQFKISTDGGDDEVDVEPTFFLDVDWSSRSNEKRYPTPGDAQRRFIHLILKTLAKVDFTE